MAFCRTNALKDRGLYKQDLLAGHFLIVFLTGYFKHVMRSVNTLQTYTNVLNTGTIYIYSMVHVRKFGKPDN